MIKRVFDLMPTFVLIVILFAGFVVTVDQLPQQPLCLNKTILKFDCPGCGLTRAFLLIPRGYWHQALHFNAGSIFIYFLFLIWLFRRLFPKYCLNFWQSLFWQRLNIGLVLGIVMMLSGHWIWKLVGFFSEYSFSQYLLDLRQNPIFWRWMI